jgi:hypothetical protein
MLILLGSRSLLTQLLCFCSAVFVKHLGRCRLNSSCVILIELASDLLVRIPVECGFSDECVNCISRSLPVYIVRRLDTKFCLHVRLEHESDTTQCTHSRH